MSTIVIITTITTPYGARGNKGHSLPTYTQTERWTQLVSFFQIFLIEYLFYYSDYC
jgi:hypothetical protein